MFLIPLVQHSLPEIRYAGWMVGTMDLGMAVRARLGEQEPLLEGVLRGLAGICQGRMPAR